MHTSQSLIVYFLSDKLLPIPTMKLSAAWWFFLADAHSHCRVTRHFMSYPYSAIPQSQLSCVTRHLNRCRLHWHAGHFVSMIGHEVSCNTTPRVILDRWISQQQLSCATRHLRSNGTAIEIATNAAGAVPRSILTGQHQDPMLTVPAGIELH